MKTNVIKRTRTIEEVVRTEYIADDGEVFYNEEECKKYEESARYVLSKKIKRILSCTEYDIDGEASSEYEVDIFNVETQEDLDNLKRYIYLKIKDNYSSYKFEELEKCMEKVTYGHEVIVHWCYDCDGIWVAGNGSIDDYGNSFKNTVWNLIKSEKEKEKRENE